MKSAVRFLRNYKLFNTVLFVTVVGLALELSGATTASHWLLAVTALIATIPLVWSMWQDVQTGKYGIDILAATAIITAVILGEYWAAIVVVLMLTGGEALENFAERRARAELDALLSHAPKKAHVIRKGKTINVAVSQIRAGDKIFIRAGEQAPVDAVIIEGTASFDESSLTGESVPQSKQTEDTILSGSINLDGAITAKALATAEDSQYQQIIKLVRGAASTQAPFVRLADRYSLPFTFFAYALASGVWLLTGDVHRFLEVIIVATPCPLLLAAPIALISGMSRASRYGIIVKTGSALERLAEARTIAFDKTGTLTRGQLTVESVIALGSFGHDEVLKLAASLEQSSSHVVAQAIVNSALEKGLKLTKAKRAQEIAGRGLLATIKGTFVVVGRLDLLEEHGVTIPPSLNIKSVKQTAVYVGIGGDLTGYITMHDEIRPEAPNTIERLRALGMRRVMMVTGDNKVAATASAKQLGIQEIYSGALPGDKLHILEAVKERPLVFVGDGVNDAPVLTGADVGIALGARGSAAASESADMVIMLDNVNRVAGAYSIAKHTFKIARQSIFIGIGLSVILMLVFATGVFTPLTGALVQEVIDVIVIFNALRAHLITIGE